MRISATDWIEDDQWESWNLCDSVTLARKLKLAGVDLIDCSSGGNTPHAKIPVGAGYQLPFADAIKRETGILTAAVGMITQPMQADQIIRNGHKPTLSCLAANSSATPIGQWTRPNKSARKTPLNYRCNTSGLKFNSCCLSS